MLSPHYVLGDVFGCPPGQQAPLRNVDPSPTHYVYVAFPLGFIRPPSVGCIYGVGYDVPLSAKMVFASPHLCRDLCALCLDLRNVEGVTQKASRVFCNSCQVLLGKLMPCACGVPRFVDPLGKPGELCKWCHQARARAANFASSSESTSRYRSKSTFQYRSKSTFQYRSKSTFQYRSKSTSHARGRRTVR